MPEGKPFPAKRSLHDRVSFLPGLDEEANKPYSSIHLEPGIPNSPYNYSGIERSEYMYDIERNNANIRIFMSIVYFIKGTVGIGYLGIHEGYSHAGLWTSLAVCLVFGLIVPHTYLMLGRSAQRLYVVLRVPKLSYPGVAEAALATAPMHVGRNCRKGFRYLIEICLYIQFCGLCCLYKLVIAETFKYALENLSDTLSQKNFNLRIYILVVTVPLGLTCASRNFKIGAFLVPVSVCADVFLAMCVITAFCYSLNNTGDIFNRPIWLSISETFNFLAVYIYSIDGSSQVLPTENSMSKPRYLNVVVNIGMMVVVIFTTSIGFFGFWVWGSACKTPFTIQMPTDLFFLVVQLILCLFLCTSYAVNLWVPFKIFWNHFGHKFIRKRRRWEIFFESSHVLLTLCCALLFPFALRLMCILGMFLSTPLTFIFPPIIETLVFWNEYRSSVVRWRLLKNLVIILIGLTVIVGGVTMNIMEPKSLQDYYKRSSFL